MYTDSIYSNMKKHVILRILQNNWELYYTLKYVDIFHELDKDKTGSTLYICIERE